MLIQIISNKLKIIGIAGLLIGLLFYSLNAVAGNETATETPPVSGEVKSQSAVEVPVPQEAAPEEPLEITTGKPDFYYDRRNREDKDRASVLERSRERYTGPKCEKDNECVKICRTIYRASVVEACTDLPLAQVKEIEEIDKVFENPTENKLANIDPEDFKVFVEIDIRPLEKRIERFTAVKAKRVLAWVVEDLGITEMFASNDYDFNLLKELLKKLHVNKKKALSVIPIDYGDSLIKLVIEEHNDRALDWIHSFFEEECDSADVVELCVLQNWYCQFELGDDEWDNLLLGYEEFEFIVDDILAYPVISPPPSWWAEDTEALNLEISQLQSLCNVELVVAIRIGYKKEAATEEAGAEEVITEEAGTTETTTSETGN